MTKTAQKIEAALVSLKATVAANREITAALTSRLTADLATAEAMQKETLSLTRQLKA